VNNISSFLTGALTLYMVVAAGIDLRTRRVPLPLTLPVMALAVGYQIVYGRQWAGLLIAWVVIFLLWKLRFYGGGDAKVLMGMFGFFPCLSLAWAQVAVALMVSLPVLVYKYRHRLTKQAATIGAMVLTGNLPTPSRENYRQNGMPVVWVYALGWLLWLTGTKLYFN